MADDDNDNVYYVLLTSASDMGLGPGHYWVRNGGSDYVIVRVGGGPVATTRGTLGPCLLSGYTSGVRAFTTLRAAYAYETDPCLSAGWRPSSDIPFEDYLRSLTFGRLSFAGPTTPKELGPRIAGYDPSLLSVVSYADLAREVMVRDFSVTMSTPSVGGPIVVTYRFCNGQLHGDKAVEYSGFADAPRYKYRHGELITWS